MDTDKVRFNCWGYQIYNLLKLVAELPRGTFGKLETHGLEVSQEKQIRASCRIYPSVTGIEIDLDKINFPPGAVKMGRKQFGGVDVEPFVFNDGFYYIYKKRPTE